jgi:hypothetical protein
MAVKRDWDTAEAVPERPRTAGFDITCVIGHVDIDPYGEGEPAHVVAFKLIAEHDSPGVYKFPMADGRTCVVGVDYALPNE